MRMIQLGTVVVHPWFTIHLTQSGTKQALSAGPSAVTHVATCLSLALHEDIAINFKGKGIESPLRQPHINFLHAPLLSCPTVLFSN